MNKTTVLDRSSPLPLAQQCFQDLFLFPSTSFLLFLYCAQMMDGTAVNVDVTAPGAIIALALMFLKVL
jgi:hypothetical protein